MNTRLMSIVAAGAVVAAAVFTLQTNQNTADTSVDYNAIMPAAGNYTPATDTAAASDVEISTDTAESEAVSKEIANMFDDEEDMNGDMAKAINDSVEPAAGHDDMAEHAEDAMEEHAEDAMEEHDSISMEGLEEHVEEAAEENGSHDYIDDSVEAVEDGIEEGVEEATETLEEAVDAVKEEMQEHIEEEAHDAAHDMMKH